MCLIEFEKENNTFHLKNKNISYIIGVSADGHLEHIYFGEKINSYHNIRRYPKRNIPFSPNPSGDVDRSFSLDVSLLEYPGYGDGDFRSPAHIVFGPEGTQVNDLKYKSHSINVGKPHLKNLPSTFVNNTNDAATLTIILEDEITKLTVELYYTIFKKYNAIARSTKMINNGMTNMQVRKISSLSIDFPKNNFEVLSLFGTWGNERQILREKIESGIKVFDSKKGASSHQHNPFVALVKQDTNEFNGEIIGEIIGACLVYSGNHETLIEKDQLEQTRLTMGINSFNFSWPLGSKEELQSPEVLLVYSKHGINDMSNTYHTLFNNCLIRGVPGLKERPVLINNWEATYFDFDDDKLIKIIDDAEKIGVEMFVLDDGWFGKRNDDTSSLGDWFEYTGKLSNGIATLSNEVHKRNMKFGMWFEPEMISPKSKLYQKHPDWAFQIPKRSPALARSQYVLDFSKLEVRENIYNQMKKIIEKYKVDYIKWDMNRYLTDVYSTESSSEGQGSILHKYILGLYNFLEKLKQEYPFLLLEGCAGGGGRFDAGWLYYMPQIWTSDNTDGNSRIKIQYGTSLVYPVSTISSHISAVPNHQTQRVTSLSLRTNVAMSGIFGLELDLKMLNSKEKQDLEKDINFYKCHRDLFQYGQFIRLKNPFEGNEAAWMFLSKDRKEAVAFFFRELTSSINPLSILKFPGLLQDGEYKINNSRIYNGDELSNIGIYVGDSLVGDFASERFHIQFLQMNNKYD
jgi:alpha-galactosidase